MAGFEAASSWGRLRPRPWASAEPADLQPGPTAPPRGPALPPPAEAWATRRERWALGPRAPQEPIMTGKGTTGHVPHVDQSRQATGLRGTWPTWTNQDGFKKKTVGTRALLGPINIGKATAGHMPIGTNHDWQRSTASWIAQPKQAGQLLTNPEARRWAVGEAAPPTRTLTPEVVDITSAAGSPSQPWRKQGERLQKLRAHPVCLFSERPMSALTCPHT